MIVSKLPKFASVALTHQQKKKRKEILMQKSIEAMICIGNFKKIFYFPNFCCKADKYCHLCYHFKCWKVLCCFIEISAWTHTVLTAMQLQKLHPLSFSKVLHTSSLRFFTLRLTLHCCYFYFLRRSIVKRFIAVT